MPRLKRYPVLDVANYRGQWLALHPTTHKIVAAGRTLKAAAKAARAKGVADPIFHGVPKSDAFFVSV
jgi:hypothetical protein